MIDVDEEEIVDVLDYITSNDNPNDPLLHKILMTICRKLGKLIGEEE